MHQDLHEQAVKLLLARQATRSESEACAARKSYNERRKEATATLRPILTQIWDALSKGESVGGFTTKEAWAEGQSIKIRWIQTIISGRKTHSVRLKVGMAVSVNGTKIMLTDAHVSFIEGKARSVGIDVIVGTAAYKSAGALHG